MNNKEERCRYTLWLSHTSDQCPAANSKVRALVEKGLPEMPKLAEQIGVKFLASEHDAVAVVEAQTVEAVNELVMRSGMVQWNSVRVYVATPMADALAELKNIPAPLY